MELQREGGHKVTGFPSPIRGVMALPVPPLPLRLAEVSSVCLALAHER